jgi:MFS family permease
MALPLANLTRRGGRRLALGTGYSVAAIGTLIAILGGTLRVLPLILAGAFMIGASSASNYQSRFAATDLASDSSRARDLSFVVWATTIGAVLGPNLLAPMGTIAPHLGLPKLTGPFVLAFACLTIGAANIWIRLKPDPYLHKHTSAGAVGLPDKIKTRIVLKHIRETPKALVGLVAVAVGHIAMVSVMVMTPVHMKHVDVSLTIIGFVLSVHVAGMYALSPLIGRASDRFGRIRVIQLGVVILLASTVISGTAAADNSAQLGIGLFLLGLGWSCTLIAGSTLLTESISDDIRPNAQGATDLVMNLSGAGGGAIAGVIIATLSYGWLCGLAAAPIVILGFMATRKRVTA